ncbi:MAG: rhomboid family intramembrane serine protease [Acidobacteria bacterium]|nr:rhomboid family intramembrane serine protease [Acidobacteriota bacterium]
MIPLRDSIPRSRFPFLTLALITLNCAIFVQELLWPAPVRSRMIEAYALVPARTVGFFLGLSVPVSQAILPFFSSMFLHGGWMHLIGNMWFLWIFGDNVEDRLGHLRYFWLYLGSGLAGAVVHVFFNPSSSLPTVGASGAIAGVMGAYLITFPGSRILTLVPIFFFLTTVEVPAYLILIYWLLLQFLSGVASISLAQSVGGVAWFAHIGGFLAGIVLMLALRKSRRSRASEWL